MYPVFWRLQYDPKRDKEEGKRAAIDFTGQESLTQQSFTADSDLNVIVKRMGIRDGEMPPPVSDPRYYGDLTDVPDLRRCLDIGRNAVDRFMALPADLRSRFHNDPAILHRFVSDPRNLDECVRLGLLKDPKGVPPEGKPVETVKEAPKAS